MCILIYNIYKVYIKILIISRERKKERENIFSQIFKFDILIFSMIKNRKSFIKINLILRSILLNKQNFANLSFNSRYLIFLIEMLFFPKSIMLWELIH